MPKSSEKCQKGSLKVLELPSANTKHSQKGIHINIGKQKLYPPFRHESFQKLSPGARNQDDWMTDWETMEGGRGQIIQRYSVKVSCKIKRYFKLNSGSSSICSVYMVTQWGQKNLYLVSTSLDFQFLFLVRGGHMLYIIRTSKARFLMSWRTGGGGGGVVQRGGGGAGSEEEEEEIVRLP